MLNIASVDVPNILSFHVMEKIELRKSRWNEIIIRNKNKMFIRLSNI
jgi:hypothetical protein